jgi:hypothetical protein
MFLSLEDTDLKDIGIKALGPRKKILMLINQCREAEQSTTKQEIGVGNSETQSTSTPTSWAAKVAKS